MSKSRQISYSQALTELEKIVGEIESEEIDVDALAEKVKRAAYLIKSCRGRLRSTEEDVKKALTEVEEGTDAKGSGDEEIEEN
ncbi:MAG: exodeoxyribonuclease VII small subunit [Thermodesulfovibrionales bacterium]